MLGPAFWAIQVCLIVIMVVMTVRGTCKVQDAEQTPVHVRRQWYY